VLTAHAFCIDSILRDYTSRREANGYEMPDDKRLVLNEMLTMALKMDYADEQGRRKIFETAKMILRTDGVPQSLLSPTVDIIRTICAEERHFIRTMAEIIQEVSDNEMVQSANVGPSSRSGTSDLEAEPDGQDLSNTNCRVMRSLQLMNESLQRIENVSCCPSLMVWNVAEAYSCLHRHLTVRHLSLDFWRHW